MNDFGLSGREWLLIEVELDVVLGVLLQGLLELLEVLVLVSLHDLVAEPQAEYGLIVGV